MQTARSITVFAPAKINLYLHVTGRRDDGYHLLDSLVAFADIGDQIKITPANDFSLTVQGPFAGAFTAGERDASPNSANLAVRAAWALARSLQREPRFRLTLVKNLPLASGLGGGSADAAAVIWGLMEYWGMSPQGVSHINNLMSGLGADVPACFECQPVFMEGIGDVLTPAPALPELPVLLVNPGKPCPTAQVFRNFGGHFSAPLEMGDDLGDAGSLLSFLEGRENMLTDAALAMVPDIAAVIGALRAQGGCRLARLSGSGATCFGIFDDEESLLDAAENLTLKNPSWWVRAGTLNRPERY